jgi:hypothetical protein
MMGAVLPRRRVGCELAGLAKMRHGHQPRPTGTRGTRNRIGWRFLAFVLFSTGSLLVTLSAAKTPPARSFQEKEQKARPLRWDPPEVDTHVPSVSATPACSLPDVLNRAGQRAQELVDHLQNFIAHEQVRFEQTERLGVGRTATITGTQQIQLKPADTYFAAKFDYVVDFGKKSEPLNIHEYRKRIAGSDDRNLAAILDKGLPVLALIFHPSLQSDYEMRCEGATDWNNKPAWVVHFHQMRGKRPRTVSMETATELRPHSPTKTEARPLSLKGRAWIAADSGQVMHLETNLVEANLMIDLQEMAFSVDYSPVKFESQNVEIWLPQFAVAYTDYAQRRMIIEHTFSDLQLFSVQTQQVTKLKLPTGNDVGNGEPGELNSPAESGSPKVNTDSEGKNAPASKTSSSESHSVPWSPPDVDENISPVEPGATCNAQEVLEKAGTRIQEFVANLDRFTATESLLQETISKSGEVSGTLKRTYAYLVSIQEVRPGILSVQEYLSSGATPADIPGGLTTKGLSALVLVFHPYYSESFSMRCEGLATLNGQRTWQIYFRQRADKPNVIRAYSIGANGLTHPIALKGRAWFDADNYQIVSLEADLIDAHPDIQLTVDHTAVEYGPVHFSSRGVDMWLPKTAELYSDFRRRRIHRRESFSNYLLFAVDEKQKDSSPKTSP